MADPSPSPPPESDPAPTPGDVVRILVAVLEGLPQGSREEGEESPASDPVEDVNIGRLCDLWDAICCLLERSSRLFKQVVDKLKAKVTHVRTALGADPQHYQFMDILTFPWNEMHLLIGQKLNQMFSRDSLRSSLEYESADGMLDKSRPNSANSVCRKSLQSLHRSLAFTIAFMEGVRNAQGTEKIATVARQAYDNTMASYHSWMERQMAAFALRSLPDKDTLLTAMFGSLPAGEVAAFLERFNELASRLYALELRIYSAYTELRPSPPASSTAAPG